MKTYDYTLEQLYELLRDPKNDLYTKLSYSHLVKTNGKVINTTLGKLWFNKLLPDDYQFIDYEVNKKLLTKIINNIAIKYGPTVSTEVLNRINKEGFYLTTIIPTSFKPESFIIPPELLKRRNELLKANLPPEEFVKNIETLGQEFLDYLKVHDDGLYNIMASGARKEGALGMGVILFAKGPVVGIDGKISNPILGSVNDGFNLEDWYKSADQSRFVLTVRAIATAEPGSLAREVFYANANTQLDYNSDCKTKKYLELNITSSIRPIINGRYYLNEKTNDLEKITSDSDILGKVIKMRSPIYCKQKDHNICSMCYGELGDKLQTRNIGMVSGSIINLVGIQSYSMKMRHNSSQVQMRPVNFIKDFIRV